MGHSEGAMVATFAAGAEGSELIIVEEMNHLLKKANNEITQKLSYSVPTLPLHEDLGKGVMGFIMKVREE